MQVVASGGSGVYSYSWSNGTKTSNTSSTTNSLSGLAAGNYTVTVTDDKGGSTTASATVAEPMKLTASIQKTDVSCGGTPDGTVDLTVVGGAPPYTFMWSNGATTEDLIGLDAKTYKVTVMDHNHCETIAEVTLKSQSTLKTSATVLANVSCHAGTDGKIGVVASGGEAPYTYLWSDGSATAEVANLPAGNYGVTVTDNKGCISTEKVTVTEPAVLTAAALVESDASCFDGDNGAVMAGATGGTSPYTYAWSNSATTEKLTGLSAGTYTVTITDANNCTATESATVKEPAPLSVALTVNQEISCNGGATGAVTAQGAGGTAPYAYTWNNAATTGKLSGLSAGTYTVTITDANNCTSTGQVVLSEPAAIVAVTSVDANVSCNGGKDGAASVSVSGGNAPYSYYWVDDANGCGLKPGSLAKCSSVVSEAEKATDLPAGNYTVYVMDAQGCHVSAKVTIVEPAALIATATVAATVSCNGESDGAASVQASGGTAPYTYAWDNSATTEEVGGLAAATYQVTVTDANGCTATTTVTVTEPAGLVASATVDKNLTCFGGADGSATATATGGTGPYSFAWANDESVATATSLTAGTHEVVVTDANGCSATAQVTLTQPAPLQVNAVAGDTLSCFGANDGIAAVAVRGGTGSYAYAWSTQATTPSIFDLAAGMYYVTVTDGKGCTQTDSVAVVEPDELQLAFTTTDDSGAGDGSLTVATTRNQGPVVYTWDTDPVATTDTLTDLAAGTYTVTVQDAMGCVKTESVSVPLMGESCTSSIAIDSLFGHGMNVATRTHLMDNTAYPHGVVTDENLIAGFGHDKLYHATYFSFVGDGNIYHIRTSDLDSVNVLTDTRAALFAGDCGSADLMKWNLDESELDANARIEIQTVAGMEYTLLVDGVEGTGGRYGLEVMRMATTGVRTALPTAITVYPNPTTGVVRLPELGISALTVTDSYGRLVLQQRNASRTIDLSDLPRGMYYLHLTTAEQQHYTSRIVKQ